MGKNDKGSVRFRGIGLVKNVKIEAQFTSAELIPTLKNRESIHFLFLL